jgi:hypothetical protein
LAGWRTALGEAWSTFKGGTEVDARKNICRL